MPEARIAREDRLFRPFLEYGRPVNEFSPTLFELRTGQFENPIGRCRFETVHLDGNWPAIGYVPEPCAWLLLLSAAACGTLVRRRRSSLR